MARKAQTRPEHVKLSNRKQKSSEWKRLSTDQKLDLLRTVVKEERKFTDYLWTLCIAINTALAEHIGSDEDPAEYYWEVSEMYVKGKRLIDTGHWRENE